MENRATNLKNKKLVVLDKSYLQGCKDRHLKALTEDRRLLITAELFHEILTDGEKSFRLYFNKLLKFRDSIDLIDHIGTLFKYEFLKLLPCTPLSSHLIPGALNPNYNFELTRDQKAQIEDFYDFWEVSGPNNFEKIVLEISKKCPALKPEDIAGNKELVLEAYERLKLPYMPPTEKIDKNWAIFRRLQIDLIATIDYMHSYSDGQFDIKQNKKAHDQIDFKICILGILAGSIATRDKKMKRYFKLLCPEGEIFYLNYYP